MTFQLAGRLDASPCVPAKPFSGIDSAVEVAMLARNGIAGEAQVVFFLGKEVESQQTHRPHPKDG